MLRLGVGFGGWSHIEFADSAICSTHAAVSHLLQVGLDHGWEHTLGCSPGASQLNKIARCCALEWLFICIDSATVVYRILTVYGRRKNGQFTEVRAHEVSVDHAVAEACGRKKVELLYKLLAR